MKKPYTFHFQQQTSPGSIRASPTRSANQFMATIRETIIQSRVFILDQYIKVFQRGRSVKIKSIVAFSQLFFTRQFRIDCKKTDIIRYITLTKLIFKMLLYHREDMASSSSYSYIQGWFMLCHILLSISYFLSMNSKS